MSRLIAVSAPPLERMGVGLALPVSILMVGSISSGPLIRLFQRRRLEREKDRVLALYEEIDRRLGPTPDGSEEPRRVS